MHETKTEEGIHMSDLSEKDLKALHDKNAKIKAILDKKTADLASDDEIDSMMNKVADKIVAKVDLDDMVRQIVEVAAEEEKQHQKEVTKEGNPAKPTGKAGEEMLARMNESHAALTMWGLSHFDWRGDENVLDIGCGGGANLKHMSARIKTGHLTGIDYSKISVQESRKLNADDIEDGRMDILEGSVEKLPFDDDSFDKITTVESFYFWPDPPKNLKEVYRVLKKGGTFLLIAEIYGRPDLSTMVQENIIRYHLYNPTPEVFGRIFREADFTNVEIHIEPTEGWICVEGKKE